MGISSPPNNSRCRIAVVGGGIVGVCCALYLQRDGHSVAIIDPGGPGE
ncbi:MAG: FAD-dependent oxidoreductase, partial [Acidobacteriota bacterium]|nr:FAD-dependent oxidoreductase [Acidobacteriota bacterium]